MKRRWQLDRTWTILGPDNDRLTRLARERETSWSTGVRELYLHRRRSRAPGIYLLYHRRPIRPGAPRERAR